MKLSRRDFLHKARQGAIVASVAALGGGAYGTFLEPLELTLDRIKVPIAGLPDALDGFKIVQISDIHLHPFTRVPLVEKAVRLTNELKPDLIALTGDFIYLDVHAIDALAPLLASMNARHGLFATLGNHEFRKGALLVQEALEKNGIHVLRNRGLELGGGAPLFLAGVDSAVAAHPRPKQAVEGRRNGITTLMLAHEPDFADYVAEIPGIQLQLSGHSHGGQIRLPLVGPVILPDLGRKYIEGLHRVKDLQVYTNRGLGTIGLPIRFNCPPQVSEITLVRA